jgi:hypothetical protein
MDQSIEEKLLCLFSRQELSHITLWRENDTWYIIKKKPFQEERIFYNKDLSTVISNASVL